ncbi:MAG TPA: hypothetical protein VHY20_12750 [Pirellulales bacterium]|jgi:hypothetical protein|nr:hypothetical protein [Pirellulales bacterium]
MNRAPDVGRLAGEQRKNAALDLLAACRELFMLRGRRALLLRLLDASIATADDVRDSIELPPDLAPVCLGAVPLALVRAGLIERAGFASTRRPAAHARPISVWRLVDRGKAVRWLAQNPDRPDPGDGNEKAQRQLGLPLGDGSEPSEARTNGKA